MMATVHGPGSGVLGPVRAHKRTPVVVKDGVGEAVRLTDWVMDTVADGDAENVGELVPGTGGKRAIAGWREVATEANSQTSHDPRPVPPPLPRGGPGRAEPSARVARHQEEHMDGAHG